jgi:hypothetical protein
MKDLRSSSKERILTARGDEARESLPDESGAPDPQQAGNGQVGLRMVARESSVK